MRPARTWLFGSLWVWHLLYGMVLASRVFLVGQPGCCGPGSDEYICGRQALLSAHRGLGAEPKSAQGAPLRGGGGSDDLQSLCGLADRAGFGTAVVKIPLTELAQLGTPCIAYLWNGHFAAVSPLNGGPPSFVHIAEVPRTLAADEVASLYSSFALLIAKDASAFPEPKAEGPDLRLDTYNWDFGAVNQDIPVECIVKLRNLHSQLRGGQDRGHLSLLIFAVSYRRALREQAQGASGLHRQRHPQTRRPTRQHQGHAHHSHQRSRPARDQAAGVRIRGGVGQPTAPNAFLYSRSSR